METKKVFVYGTLRQGWGLNRYIQDCGGVLLETTKLKGYKMYSLGGYPAINQTTSEDSVVGEVYEFPKDQVDTAFNIMDRIELGAGYRRDRVKVGKHDVYTYVYERGLEGSRPSMIDWTKEARR